MTACSYSREQLQAAISSSSNLRQALLQLGLQGKGGNYRVIKHQCDKYQISYDHLINHSITKSIRKTSPPPTLDEIRAIVPHCKSWRAVARSLGLTPEGGNVTTLRDKCDANNIDHSHFTGQAVRKHDHTTKIPIEDYFSNKRPIQSNRFKKRLIREGYFEHKCYRCLRTQWEGEPIPIELEHIDGNHENNARINLTILCYNCHSLTPTFRGRNKKSNPTPIYGKTNQCRTCRVPILKVNTFCKNCCPKGRPRGSYNPTTLHKTPRLDELKSIISKEKLLELVSDKGLNAIGNQYETSYILIKQLCKYYGITPPTIQERNAQNKQFIISNNELQQLIDQHSFEKVGQLLGVTGNAIRRRCRTLKLTSNDKRFTNPNNQRVTLQ